MRPRLLFLCQTLPYPPDGGVWIRSFHVLRLLSRAFDVTALCFERSATSNRNDLAEQSASRDALSRFGRVEVFPIPQRHSRARFAWDHVRSLGCGRPYTVFLYDSGEFRGALKRLVQAVPFDLVHIDSFDLVDYLPDCAGVPVVCVHHDVESDQLHRRAAIERGRLRRVYLKHQARLTERAERRLCDRFALNVAVSEPDRRAILRMAPAARVAIVPNGVDCDEFQPDGSDGRGVAFVGGMNWFPNRDALEHFCADIQPELRAMQADVPARWIGAATPSEQQLYRDRHGIELTGYVDDVRPFMREAACHIVPLRAGSGTRLKILNSWAMGKAVVSTSIGCEGLAAVDGDNILIEDDPKRFAAAIVSVLGDAALRRRLGARGRATAERLYSWDVIGRNMIHTYFDLANVGRSSSPGVAAAGAGVCRRS